MTVKSVGVIGLGAMGKPIARHIVKAGFPTTVYDTRDEPMVELEALGARRAANPRALGQRSDMTLIIVPAAHQVCDVCLGPDGLLEGAPSGSVVSICSTVSPATCHTIFEAAMAKGIGVIDSAMIRAVSGAEAGTLLLMVGGEARTLEMARPVFNAFASDVCHVGKLGAGQVAKAINNLFVWINTVGTVEGFAMARAAGVDLRVLKEALALGSGDNWTLRYWDRTTQQPKWWDQKDLIGIMEIADDTGVSAPLTALTKELMKTIGIEGARTVFGDK